MHITGYRAAGGPGIEFLQYIIPGPGKPFPVGSRSDDIWHWQTTLVVDNAKVLYQKLIAAGYKVMSKDLVEQQSDNLHTISFIVRDPDGHAMLIREYVSK